MRRAIPAALLFAVLTSPVPTSPALADNESPTGRWAISAAECRSPDTGGIFTVRMRAGTEPAVEAFGRPCRLDRMAHTRLGYRLFLRCYVSRADFQADAHPVPKTVVFDAIGSERMRADGQTVYRCPAI